MVVPAPRHGDMMMETTQDCRTCKIRTLNDTLRTTGQGGKIMVTTGITGKGEAFLAATIDAMRAHDDFSPDNDPHGEHDFGRMVIEEIPVLWKIDYFDKTLEFGSDDPADPQKTCRVLTLLLAEEY